ncbi:MAG: 50S ribosomal protein L1 [Chlamydiales bacterium]|nr:50S ribosomal protein L1 [Chlamydiales bacterium]
MAKKSKRYRKNIEGLALEKTYSLEEAAEILKKLEPAKFDETVELNIKTGVDPKKADQMVRGTVSLPHGTGQKIVLVVFAKGEKEKEALEAGADFAGSDELFEKIKNGWTDFNAVIATPDMMREVGKLGKVLGPHGLMPSPKAGTVTTDVAKAVAEIKAGKVEYKVDKSGNMHNAIGKISFEGSSLVDNAKALLSAIVRAKPVSVKGSYLQTLYMSSTMGPGIKIDINSATQAVN